MIEYANDSVIKLLKQYDMLAKSLKFITDITQKNDISDQMTKIIKQVLDITNSIYEKKYMQILNRSVYLIEDEKNRLLELINLINERIVYVNNQLTSNEELTGVSVDTLSVLGENKLDEYKSNLKIIERYQNNIKLERTLKEEIKSLDVTIKRANAKIANNKNLNRQLEERMIRVVEGALNKLSLFELIDREKEIDLAYTELGYSLEKAKENAKIARRDCNQDIIAECDNILASTTLDYERYKEKKLILKLIYLYKQPVSSYDDLLSKREEINNILLNITDSELYSIVGGELNKEYSTIKLESQDMATLKSLMEEKELKMQSLSVCLQENDSESVKGMLSTLLLNEKKHQEKLEEERRRAEEKRKRLEKIEEQRKMEEFAKRQKALEEERKKEIEMRTRQLLDEKKNSLLVSSKEDVKKDVVKNSSVSRGKVNVVRGERPKTGSVNFDNRVSSSLGGNSKKEKEFDSKRESYSKKVVSERPFESGTNHNDFFADKRTNSKVVSQGIPVVRDNKVVTAKKVETDVDKIFPEIPINKEKDIFPDISSSGTSSSFFDENEFNDLSDYMEGSKKKSWF